MVDPVKPPPIWNPRFQAYADHHSIYDVFQDLLKELSIWKPKDALLYIKEELPRIAKSIYKPKVFLVGPEPAAPSIGENIAKACGAIYLTFEEVIETSPSDTRHHLREYLRLGDTHDEPLRKLLIATLSRRLSMDDCISNGYVLYGFPQSRAQAMAGQMGGLLPRQVFVLLPKGPPGKTKVVHQQPKISTRLDEVSLPKLSKAANISIKEFQQYKNYFKTKEIVSAFHPQIVKVVSYEQWSVSKPSNLEAEFLGVIITKFSRGAPWIPRIALIGPPASGKTITAEQIAFTYNLTNVDWMDVLRGAALWPDEISEEIRHYLADLTPLSDETVKTLLKRKLLREDCAKRGWVLQGFPETKRQAEIMDEMGLTPNRIFLLSCPETLSLSRMIAKRKEIIGRRIPGIKYPAILELAGMYEETETEIESDESDEGAGPMEHVLEDFPYSDYATKTRYANFDIKLDAVIAHYGTEMVFVDATKSPKAVLEFINTSVLQPPNIRF